MPVNYDFFDFPSEYDDELIAAGGTLEPEMLLSAYSHGIFPWFSNDNEPVLWWSLNPRFVLFPRRIHVSSSLKKKIKKKPYTLTLDKSFPGVITACSEVHRPEQEGTWITSKMKKAYIKLHNMGYAHSVEAWDNGTLAGGLYGVSLGGCFFGESMFALKPDASKICLVALSGFLADNNFGLIDAQQHTQHLERFGAVDMPRSVYIERLKKELEKDTVKGGWDRLLPGFPESELWKNLNG